MTGFDAIDIRARFRSLGWFSLLLLALAVFGLAFVPLRGSQDEWWHLKTGAWIWQHRGLPTHDIFTYTGATLRWYNHEWLSQVLMYAAWLTGDALSLNGMATVIFFKSLVVAGAFLIVATLGRQRGLSWPAACVIALIMADISRRSIHPRPPVFSYLLMGAFIWALTAWKQGRLSMRTLWLTLVPATIIWANLHGMVLLSFLITGFFAAGEFIEAALRWRRLAPADRPKLHRAQGIRGALLLSALTAVLILAAMAQPSGWHLFFLGRNFTADPLLKDIILEMLPTPRPFFMLNPSAPPGFDNIGIRPPGFWTFWLALAIGFVFWLRNRLRLQYAADYLLLAFFTWQAISHWRLLPLFGVGAAAPLAGLLHQRLSGLVPRWKNLEAPAATLLLGGLVLWFNFTVNEDGTFFDRNREMIQGKVANQFDYPAPLMDYIEKAGLPDHMLSDSNYCGYTIWRLSPELHKLFTDARFDLFGSQFIHLERNIFYAAEPGDAVGNEVFTESWHELLDRYGINFIVFRPVDRPQLHQALVATGGWRLIYYFIPEGSDPGQWPYNGNYVWVRNNDRASALAKKSEAIFRRQFPNELVPARIEEIVRGAQQKRAETRNWRTTTP